MLSSFDAFRLFGQAMPLDPVPAWGDIKSQALDALRKSKDLRLLAYLGAASLRTDGLPAFAESLSVASQWLEAYWSATYPTVEEDAIPRRSALNCFADQMAVIDGLRRVPLVRSRQHGTFGLRDVELATGQLQPGEADVKPDEAQINAAFAEMPLDDLKGLQQSVADSLAALKSIVLAMTAGAGLESAPEFDALSSMLTRIGRMLGEQLALRPDADEESPAAAAAAGGGAVGVGGIKSRQDAIRALDAVAEFFRRNEPSSPIPMFVERAKRLVSKNFLEVLADVVPDAVSQARTAGGVRDE